MKVITEEIIKHYKKLLFKGNKKEKKPMPLV